MKIKAFDKEARVGKYQELEVMFNPTSYSLTYGNQYIQKPSIGGKNDKPKLAYAEAKRLQIEFLLDGTGVVDLGIETLIGTATVSDRLEEFFKVCVESQGSIHQPKFLRLQWGSGYGFDCRVSSVDVSYTLFNTDGSPLRAKLNTTFIEDVPQSGSDKKNEKSSPDLTHVREVKMEDTLPLMSKDIYGSFDHFIWLARQNDLDQFRRLKPGTKIIFPPLEK